MEWSQSTIHSLHWSGKSRPWNKILHVDQLVWCYTYTVKHQTLQLLYFTICQQVFKCWISWFQNMFVIHFYRVRSIDNTEMPVSLITKSWNQRKFPENLFLPVLLYRTWNPEIFWRLASLNIKRLVLQYPIIIFHITWMYNLVSCFHLLKPKVLFVFILVWHDFMINWVSFIIPPEGPIWTSVCALLYMFIELCILWIETMVHLFKRLM